MSACCVAGELVVSLSFESLMLAISRLTAGHLRDAHLECTTGIPSFDLFSVHLYGEPASVPRYLDTARQFMRAHGYLKPVVVGEHAGPQPFEFPGAIAVMQQVFAAAFAEPPPSQSTGDLAAQARQGTPERRAMAALYARMDGLPPTLQMFMEGCPAELEAKRHRISRRQLVMRTLLALAGGVHRTAYWNLAPEYPGARRSPPDDAPDDRQAPAAGLRGRRSRLPPPHRGHLRPPRRPARGRTGRDPRRDRRPAGAPRARGRPGGTRAAARAVGPPRRL